MFLLRRLNCCLIGDSSLPKQKGGVVYEVLIFLAYVEGCSLKVPIGRPRSKILGNHWRHVNMK
jgi:hypothetical protein